MFYGNWYPNSMWEEINRDYMERYGTTDFDEIDRMKKFADKQLEIETDSRVEAKLEEMLPEIQQKAYASAIKQLKAEALIEKGKEILGISSFLSDTITVDGNKLDKSIFISERPVTDLAGEDVRLYFDDLHSCWSVNVKDGKTKLISRFVVESCFIVNASRPGRCQAYVVFLKGRADPLIFWDGIIEPSELRRQTQFHQRGLSYSRKDLYHESFMRALRMCKAVYFLTLPKHAGWNRTPEGLRIFVDSAMMRPEFEDLFLKEDTREKKCNKMYNIFCDISLESTERKLDDVVADYHSLLPDTLPITIGTVISATSRLLPQYKEEGLIQDRLLVIETSDDDTAKAIIAVLQNRNHRSTEALFSSMRMPYIEEEIMHYVDCVAIMRHFSTICSTHDHNKIVKFLYELIQNGYADDDFKRLLPVLLIDSAGIIPEEFQIHQLSIADRLKVDSIEQVQRVVGELDFHIVDNAVRNPDAVKQRLKVAVVTAKEIVSTLPRRSQSCSATMLLSTAILLREGGVLRDADVNGVQEWLRTEAKSRTSMSRSVVKTGGAKLSKLICSRILQLGIQFGPPFWTYGRALIARDDSFNITKETLDEEILPELSVGKNKALEYFEKEDFLYPDKGGGDQKTWTVETEDGEKKPRRFYSFSRDLLTPEANRIVDEAIASDFFHKLDKPIDNFFPFIKHRRLDMVAGQVITDYKHGNPFIAVTGTPGSGKSDWLMMQVLQRAKAGDVVIVLDPTNAFCREELSGHKIPDEVIDKYFNFCDITTQGWPVNIMDFSDCENTEQQTEKLSSLLISGMHLTGSKQKFALVNKVSIFLENPDNASIIELASLKNIFYENKTEMELNARLRSLFSTVNMYNDVSLTWADRLSSKGKILVISSGNATINNNANPFDIILDTLYSYKDKHKDDTVTIILDEFQTLNRYKGCTLEAILSRGRKLNLSAILASQDYTDKKDQIGRFYAYCGTHVFFRPLGEECVKVIAELTKLDANVIRTLPDFNCAVLGPIYREYYQKNIQLHSAIIGETYRPDYVGSYD